ncbi:MAG: hypothetical protein K2I77_03790 [Anaeroplasmataceae bacterium]|nr:hypothetical protein [Anaeroplasmataceae bacterium]
MIYTLTIHPAIDIYSSFENFEIGKINRPDNQLFVAGGKGINVSKILHHLNVVSKPLVIVGGFTGDYLLKSIDYLSPVAFKEEKNTRICYKISSLEETAINPKPEKLGNVKEDVALFLKKLKEEDILIVSGSGIKEDYQYLLNGVKAKLVLDVDGKVLKDLSIPKVWIVKPNNEELALVDENIECAYQKLLKFSDFILHTQGHEGATLVTKEERIYVEAFGFDLKTTVGCGDAFLAGFIKGMLDNIPLTDALNEASKMAYLAGKMEIK